MWIEPKQGRTQEGYYYGYVGEDETGGGGYYFDWRETLAETLASISADSPRRLTRSTVKKIVTAEWKKEARKETSRLIPRLSNK